MVFNSFTFMLFFAVVLLLHSLPLSWVVKKINLIVASYVFYAAWNPPFVALLWLMTVVDWFVAQAVAKATSRLYKRLFLVISLVGNLGLLAYFKYGEFLLESCIAVLKTVGIDFHPAAPSIVLPIGISFYTFVTLSYTIDVYRGQIKPARSFLDFALLVTFFPHLVAGPILRAADFLPQCLEYKKATAQQLGWGFSLITIGLFEKTVLADGILAPVADKVYGATAQAGFWDSWVGTLAFSGQIFFDFDGYSICAIGAAMCLGFIFPDNFRFPYGAIGFSDFWRRWHISLSSWLRDYLYISLGGKRHGELKTYFNLLVTMLLGGLWHGASWLFVIWGGLHGIYLAVERLIRQFYERPIPPAVVQSGLAQSAVADYGSSQLDSSLIQRTFTRGTEASSPAAAGATLAQSGQWGQMGLALLTYLLVCITWVFFRAQDLTSAGQMIANMVAGKLSGLLLSKTSIGLVLLVTGFMLALHWRLRDSSFEHAVARLPWWLRSVLLVGLLLAITLAPGDDRAFIYFQF